MTDERPRLRVTAAGHSITGPYRDHNEDRYFCNPEAGIFVVADGMGGQQAGERASGLAVELLPPLLAELGLANQEQPISVQLGEAIVRVNREIYEFGQSHPECHQMGTTVVAAFMLGDRMYVSGVGDSRVYYLSGSAIRQVTTDHTVTEALMRRGVITPEQAKVHKFRHVLWRYLGSADLGELPEVFELPLQQGDRVLLASDGLTGVVSDEELTRILLSATSPEDAVQKLAERSQELDSRDNVTCVVLAVAE
jgi:PPM family protein phosphatase